MTKLEMFDKGFILGEKLIKVQEYMFIGFGILSALIIVLIFTIVWSKNVG